MFLQQSNSNRPVTHLVSVRYEFHPVQQALNPIRQWLVIPITFVPLLHQFILCADLCNKSWGLLQLDETDAYLSPPVGFGYFSS